MQWSKNILPKKTADHTVLDFIPQKFDLGTPESAAKYLREKKHGSDFEMNEAVREQTGVDQIEAQKEVERIEELAIDKFKDIQEAAYREAYALGLQEGRNTAFDKYSANITENIESLESLLSSLETIKSETLAANESHLIKLMFYMASRLAMKELKSDNTILTEVIRNAVSLSQDEESILVQISDTQLDFLESVKKQTGREFDFLKKIKFEPNPEITPGGCIVTTNFGEVDAQIEQKVNQLWETLIELVPRVKDEMVSE